jgi:hypothetical protein
MAMSLINILDKINSDDWEQLSIYELENVQEWVNFAALLTNEEWIDRVEALLVQSRQCTSAQFRAMLPKQQPSLEQLIEAARATAEIIQAQNLLKQQQEEMEAQEQFEAVKTAAIEKFKLKLQADVAPHILEAIGVRYQAEPTLVHGSYQPVARFPLIDEAGTEWNAKLVYDDSDLRIQCPDLKQPLSTRNVNEYLWKTLQPAEGYSWNLFLPLLIDEWNQQVNELKAKAEQKRQQQEENRLRKEQQAEEQAKLHAMVREQDAEIDAVVDPLLEQAEWNPAIGSPLKVYLWKWCKGGFSHQHDDGESFDYDHAYTVRDTLDAQGYLHDIQTDRHIKLDPLVHKPVVERLTFADARSLLARWERTYKLKIYGIRIWRITSRPDDYHWVWASPDSYVEVDICAPPDWLLKAFILPRPQERIDLTPPPNIELIPRSDQEFDDINF